MSSMPATEPKYTPALAFRSLTPLYDAAIGMFTRESRWREALVAAIDLKPGERLLDVGCGTGSLLVRLHAAQPAAHLVGLDPDPSVLQRAERKLRGLSPPPALHLGFLTREFAAEHGPFDVITSSLVLHQVPLAQKTDLLVGIRDALRPDGRVYIADYGLQTTRTMRAMFRLTVQALDGLADTQPNADGIFPTLIERAGFGDIGSRSILQTPTGEIWLYSGRRPV